jgi:hypothetical protein
MNKLLSAALIASVAVLTSPAYAENTQPSAAKPAKPTTPKAEVAVKSLIAPDDDDKEQDITSSKVSEFHCELGNNVTIYENAEDDQHIGMRWLKKIHRLTRVGTSTGANRFENKKFGLVWIGIPSKSMLLDSKKGKQLANECRTAEQAEAKKISAVVPAIAPDTVKQ